MRSSQFWNLGCEIALKGGVFWITQTISLSRLFWNLNCIIYFAAFKTLHFNCYWFSLLVLIFRSYFNFVRYCFHKVDPLCVSLQLQISNFRSNNNWPARGRIVGSDPRELLGEQQWLAQTKVQARVELHQPAMQQQLMSSLSKEEEEKFHLLRIT